MTLKTINPVRGATTVDAFGRYRVSEPLTVFDSKQIFDNQPLFWDDVESSGSGTSSTHSANRASTVIAVGTVAGKRTRQTFQRFNYQPGKSLLVLFTARLDVAPGSGIEACVGYFDDDNGVFFEAVDGVVGVTVRSNVTGSPVDTTVAQADWNGDRLDGTGPSGATLDPTKVQVLWMDFEWLGVGTVRFGFIIDGAFILAHQFNHANVESSVYMSTANLPVRYSIENTGGGAATGLEQICATVISEGGMSELGTLRYKSTSGTHIDANTANTIYALVGIRLKSAYLGETVTIENVSILNQANSDFEWLLIFNPTVAGTFTYSDETDSAIQTAVGEGSNPSTSTVTGGTVITGGFIKSGAQAGSVGADIDNALRLGATISGTVDEIVLCARPLAANADIEGSITWREAS